MIRTLLVAAALGLILFAGCHSDPGGGQGEAVLGSGPDVLFSSRLFQDQQYDMAFHMLQRSICGDTHYMPCVMVYGLLEAAQEAWGPGGVGLLEGAWGMLVERCGSANPCSGSSIIAHYSSEDPTSCQWIYIMSHPIIEALFILAPGLGETREARIREIFQTFLSDATGVEIPYETAEVLYASSNEKRGSCCCDLDDDTYVELSRLDFPAIPPPRTGEFSPDVRYGGPGHRTWREEVAFQGCGNCGFNPEFDPVEQVWCFDGGEYTPAFSSEQCAEADWSRIDTIFPPRGEWGRQTCNFVVGPGEESVLTVLADNRGDGTSDWRIMACLNDGTGTCRESLPIVPCEKEPGRPDGYPGPSGLFWD